MGVTLDTGAVIAYQECLERKDHPLKEHIAGWSRDKVILSTPSVAWAEYWRGRGENEHFIAKLRKRVQVDAVSKQLGEAAAAALRVWSPNDDRNTVKHLIDAIVMAYADTKANTVYTADIEDLGRLWEHFTRVRALVSATTGQVVLKR